MTKHGLSPLDPSSYSRPEEIIVRNIHIALEVSFEKKTLNGSVQLTIEKIDPKVDNLILDVKSLYITSVVDTATNENLNFAITDPVESFGSKLTIDLPPGDTKRIISISYETSPDASGLQWLSPEQTAGKVHPYLFSQFQPIHARSMIPCQDTPFVKTPYTAEITVPSPLIALMSALRGEKSTKGDKTTYLFHQKVPMPSYLIAIVVGALESREIGPRSHVWAEKEIVNKGAFEFSETEKQLEIAEEICGPYVWGIYDLLILPPSFPYGGMENPCLTFITPTLLAGDRSLANVVAHEAAHSWTGNLVTNRNFEHFWLNEGFTMFIERKILERLTTKQNKDLSAIEGLHSLEESVKVFGKDNPLTSLIVNLVGVHPDDAFSSVPYEKGYIFLRYLQDLVGGNETMNQFLRSYFNNFKYKSIDSSDFKKFFIKYFEKSSNISQIDWNAWLHAPGMPKIIPKYDDSLAKVYKDLRDKWVKWDISTPMTFSDQDLSNFTTLQKICFFNELLNLENFSLEKVKKLSDVYKLKDSHNYEIIFVWLRLCLKAKWEEKIDDAIKMVTEVGRMKYTRPLYRDMGRWDVARPKAIANFHATKNHMMSFVADLIAKDLGISN